MPQTNRTCAEQYIASVLAGDILTSKWVRLQLQNHSNDLSNGHLRGLRFNRVRAGKALEFIDRFIPQTDDTNAGKPLVLLPFQRALIWIYYGWEYAATGFRRFKIAYIELARGNGKSALLSALALMELLTGPPATEVYSAATDKATARLVWETARDMATMSPFLKDRVVVYRNNLNVPARNAKYEPLSSQDRNLQGKRPSFVVLDELHAHASRGVWDAMVMAMGKRDNSRLFALTTAGYDRNSICWQTREYSIKVLQGIIPDDSWFSFIACLDDGDDWQDESLWIKANPALGSIVKLADMREQALKASSDPASLNAFLRYRLSVWTDSAVAWLPMEMWDRCSGAVDAEALTGRPCIGGLDLSTTTDISALVLLFPPYGEDKHWRVLPHFFLPADNIAKRVKKDRVPYDVWSRQELFQLTPGNIIDYAFIRAKANELAARYDIRELAFDPYNATQLVTELGEDGITMVPFRQGDVSMNAPCKRLMELVLTGELAHGNNPVLRWMASNTVVRVGATGLLKPDKERSAEKIDGISALLDALGRAMVVVITPKQSAGFLFAA
jgi:phage terminase large subunit-like protein